MEVGTQGPKSSAKCPESLHDLPPVSDGGRLARGCPASTNQWLSASRYPIPSAVSAFPRKFASSPLVNCEACYLPAASLSHLSTAYIPRRPRLRTLLRCPLPDRAPKKRPPSHPIHPSSIVLSHLRPPNLNLLLPTIIRPRRQEQEAFCARLLFLCANLHLTNAWTLQYR